jgi:hypothetical protein
MSVESEEVLDFAEKIERELSNDADKIGWKGRDVWWYLGQLVKEVRLLDGELTANSQADIFKKTTSIAAFALIMANIQKEKRATKTKTAKAIKRKT